MSNQIKIGDKVNKLTIIEFLENYKVKCLCDCGNISYPKIFTLKTGKVKSCGCVQKEFMKNRIPVNKKQSGESALNTAYNHYRVDARNRQYDFEITFEDFRKITSKNCFYCNKAPSNISRSRNDNGDYIYNGIDRFNNEKGYVFGNCVPCCADCNTMKTTKSLNELIKKCNLITETILKNTFYRELKWSKCDDE